jgi:hypothetical protein
MLLAAMTSVNAFAANISCNSSNARGEDVTVNVNTTTGVGKMTTNKSTAYNLKVYIVNDNAQGAYFSYFAEGLAQAPYAAETDPATVPEVRMFRIFVGNDKSTGTFTTQTTGGSDKQVTKLSGCSIQ